MVDKIKFKRTKTAGRVPAASSIEEGEIHLNLADRAIFTKNGSEVIKLGGSDLYTVDIVPYNGTTTQNKAITLPYGLKWSDFEYVEVYAGYNNVDEWSVSNTITLTKEIIAYRPKWKLLATGYDINHSAVYAGNSTTHGGNIETQCYVGSDQGYGVKQIKGFTKARPETKQFARDVSGGLTLLWEGESQSGVVNLAEPITGFDAVMLSGMAANVGSSSTHSVDHIRSYSRVHNWCGPNFDVSWAGGEFTTDNTFTINGSGNSLLRRIYGIKYAQTKARDAQVDRLESEINHLKDLVKNYRG